MELITVTHNPFSSFGTISKNSEKNSQTIWSFVKQCSKKESKMIKDKHFWSNWFGRIPRKPLSFWLNVVFSAETRLRFCSADLFWMSFFWEATENRFIEKKNAKTEFEHVISYFLDCYAIQPSERKRLLRWPNRSNVF